MIVGFMFKVTSENQCKSQCSGWLCGQWSVPGEGGWAAPQDEDLRLQEPQSPCAGRPCRSALMTQLLQGVCALPRQRTGLRAGPVSGPERHRALAAPRRLRGVKCLRLCVARGSVSRILACEMFLLMRGRVFQRKCLGWRGAPPGPPCGQVRSPSRQHGCVFSKVRMRGVPSRPRCLRTLQRWRYFCLSLVLTWTVCVRRYVPGVHERVASVSR